MKRVSFIYLAPARHYLEKSPCRKALENYHRLTLVFQPFPADIDKKSKKWTFEQGEMSGLETF